MPEEQGTPPEGSNVSEVKASDLVTRLEVLEQINKGLQEKLESQKNEISTRDRKLTEIQQAKKELEESSLSESEKLRLEMERIKTDMQLERSERTKSDNKAKALEFMTENGIDRRYLDFVPLDNSENMIEKLKSLATIAGEERQRGAKDVVNKLGGDIPLGGTVPDGGIITADQYKSLSPSERQKALKEGRVQGFGKL